jgi:hypothetical protein
MEESENADCDGITILPCGDRSSQRKTNQQQDSQPAGLLPRDPWKGDHCRILTLVKARTGDFQVNRVFFLEQTTRRQ